jgi:hypothetical protein
MKVAAGRGHKTTMTHLANGEKKTKNNQSRSQMGKLETINSWTSGPNRDGVWSGVGDVSLEEK